MLLINMLNQLCTQQVCYVHKNCLGEAVEFVSQLNLSLKNPFVQNSNLLGTGTQISVIANPCSKIFKCFRLQVKKEINFSNECLEKYRAIIWRWKRTWFNSSNVNNTMASKQLKACNQKQKQPPHCRHQVLLISFILIILIRKPSCCVSGYFQNVFEMTVTNDHLFLSL